MRSLVGPVGNVLGGINIRRQPVAVLLLGQLTEADILPVDRLRSYRPVTVVTGQLSVCVTTQLCCSGIQHSGTESATNLRLPLVRHYMPREILQLDAGDGKLLPGPPGNSPPWTVREALPVRGSYTLHKCRLHHGRIHIDLCGALHSKDVQHADHLLLGIIPLRTGHSTSRATVGRTAITTTGGSDHLRDFARDRLASWHFKK